MTSPADLVRLHLEAFSRGDLPSMLATLAPDADFVTGTTRVAPRDFPSFFGGAMRELSPTMQIGTIVASGQDVACEFVESLTIDGAFRSLRRAAFFRVVDGLIVSVRVYDVRSG